MKRLTTRVRAAVASAAIAGGALLGTGGPASAAVAEPVAHSKVAGTVPENDGRVGYSAGGHVRGHEGERDDGWSGYRGRQAVGNRPDHQHDQLRKGKQRWDGHGLYVWYEGRWIDVTLVREAAGVDRWYADQLREAATADRWYADQLVLARPSARSEV
ncbi:hypothetical protein [Streptomyces sp. NPDC052107]|jgi:hypothetical protein|uniref:hypothetical protein n=1 Tax=Streptomyces sp. NPDC052107 TaxID=3155632 RepID=UPI0034222921